MPATYVYPGTTVLRNKPEFRDHAQLDEFERYAVSLRAGVLQISTRDLYSPAAPALLHKQLFQDIYPWAGQHRTVNISKSNSFLPASRIDLGLAEVKRRLDACAPPATLAALAKRKHAPREGEPGAAETFAALLVAPVAELNYVHPFREGNGRMTRAWLDQLAQRAGLRLDPARVNKQDWLTGSIESTVDPTNTQRLQTSIADALVPDEEPPEA